MGAGQSRAEPDDEKVFYSETPIQFGEEVVNHLADNAASPTPSPERQSSIDAHVRARIQSELEHLRQQEDEVKAEIERALEKENLDREKAMAGEESASEDSEDGASEAGRVRNSTVLLGDLEELRTKVERFQSRRALSEFPAVQAASEAVVSCYKSNPSTTLDCWREVQHFKEAVSHVEEHYIDSLRS